MTERASEVNLARRAAEGDKGAMTRLYEQCSGRVYSLIRRLCGDDDLAADLSQEVWVRALRSIARFDGRVPFCGWLGAIGRNLVIDEFRRRGSIDPLSLEDEAGPIPARNPLPDIAVERVDLERCLDALPEGYRTIVVLRAIEGLPHTEIAERLGIEPVTSRTQFHKARARMARWLIEDDNP